MKKNGDKSELPLKVLYARVGELASELRQQGKPVLILSNSVREKHLSDYVLDLTAECLLHLDFDRCAIFALSHRLNGLRDLMLRAKGLDSRVANFQAEPEVLAWLAKYFRQVSVSFYGLRSKLIGRLRLKITLLSHA